MPVSDRTMTSSRKNKHIRAFLTTMRPLLVSNISPNARMFDLLSDNGILSAITRCDLQSEDSREIQVGRLVDLVAAQGKDAWINLIKALRQCGHVMLADYLVYQENEMMTQERQNEDIIKLFPRLDAALSQTDKKAIREWVKNKMAQVSLRALSSQTSSRQESEDQDGLPTAPSYKSQVEMVLAINDKDKQITTLRDAVTCIQTQIQHKDGEIRMLRQELSGAKKEHSEEMKNLAKQSSTSERTISMLRERMSTIDNSIKSMNVKISKHFGVDEQAARYNTENVRIGILDQNVKKLVERILELEDTLSWRQEQWKEDRGSVLKSIQVLDRGQSVADSLQDYVCKIREGLDGLLEEMYELGLSVGVQIPQLSGGSRNTNNNRLHRMPSPGEYTEINNKLKELKEKIDEVVDENKLLRQGYRKPSPGLNLLMKRSEVTGYSTDSDPSDTQSGSMNIYSGKSYYRKGGPQSNLTPIDSPSMSRNYLFRSPHLEKRGGENGYLPEITSSSSNLYRLMSPRQTEDKQNQVNQRLLDIGSAHANY